MALATGRGTLPVRPGVVRWRMRPIVRCGEHFRSPESVGEDNNIPSVHQVISDSESRLAVEGEWAELGHLDFVGNGYGSSAPTDWLLDGTMTGPENSSCLSEPSCFNGLLEFSPYFVLGLRSTSNVFPSVAHSIERL